jgi:hypothetical protein
MLTKDNKLEVTQVKVACLLGLRGNPMFTGEGWTSVIGTFGSLLIDILE